MLQVWFLERAQLPVGKYRKKVSASVQIRYSSDYIGKIEPRYTRTGEHSQSAPHGCWSARPGIAPPNSCRPINECHISQKRRNRCTRPGTHRSSLYPHHTPTPATEPTLPFPLHAPSEYTISHVDSSSTGCPARTRCRFFGLDPSGSGAPASVGERGRGAALEGEVGRFAVGRVDGGAGARVAVGREVLVGANGMEGPALAGALPLLWDAIQSSASEEVANFLYVAPGKLFTCAWHSALSTESILASRSR